MINLDLLFPYLLMTWILLPGLLTATLIMESIVVLLRFENKNITLAKEHGWFTNKSGDVQDDIKSN